jgi:hypothetical protein
VENKEFPVLKQDIECVDGKQDSERKTSLHACYLQPIKTNMQVFP